MVEKMLLSECSVAVHLRGLYGVSATGKMVAELPTLSNGYYRAAIDLLCKKLESPRLFIFSDGTDPSRLLDLCPSAIPVSEVCKGMEDYEELWLMGRCKHHIIANSSFSWWGAWLQGNREHIVVSPRMELYGQLMTTPPNWIVVDV